RTIVAALPDRGRAPLTPGRAPVKDGTRGLLDPALSADLVRSLRGIRRAGQVTTSAAGNLLSMSAGHAYELPADDSGTAVADALAEVESGQIAYLTRAGQPVAALVSSPELIELQHAADTAASAEAEAIRARPGPRIPHEVLEAMMAADDSTHDEMA